MLSAPRKEIFNPDDMSKWLKSEAYQVYRFSAHNSNQVNWFELSIQEYLGFILAVNEAVQGKKASSIQLNDKIGKVVGLLECLDRWIDEIPPTEQPQRFGNKSFRVWFQRLKDVSYSEHLYVEDNEETSNICFF